MGEKQNQRLLVGLSRLELPIPWLQNCKQGLLGSVLVWILIASGWQLNCLEHLFH